MDMMASRTECKACTRAGVLSVVQGGGNNACLSTYTLDQRERGSWIVRVAYFLGKGERKRGIHTLEFRF